MVDCFWRKKVGIEKIPFEYDFLKSLTMKRLSEKQKKYQLRRRTKLDLRRMRSSKVHKHIRIYGSNSRPPANGEIGFRLKRVTIYLPKIFSFQDNYDETIRFIDDLKDVGIRNRRNLKVDFRPLEQIGVAAALVLAAELDRWRRLAGFKLSVVDLDEWNPHILRLFGEMGLFDLLVISNVPQFVEQDTDLSFVRFRTARKAIGDEVRELRSELEWLIGLPVPDKSKLYRGLTEAMTNVSNHAYPEKVISRTPRLRGQWWMVASYNKVTQVLTIAFFDQGVGIPATIPVKNAKEKIEEFLNKFGLIENDASLIRAAMELQRSETEQSHRGYGLFRDIRNYTNSTTSGNFRIMSGKGEYIYSPANKALKNGEKMLTHSVDIEGTLIQWEATLSAE